MLFGSAAINKLHNCRVAVFGVGGVGGFACEALVRSGIGAFDLIDNDTVSLTNLNRQIIATHSSIGRYKVDIMKERMLDINPNVDVRTYKTFVSAENVDEFPFDEYDYVIDAIDTVSAKIQIILMAKEAKVPIISSMGAGNKLDGSNFKISDIYKTRYCPLAKVMRHEMKKRGVAKLKVVYSEEPATRPIPEIAKLVSEEKELAAAAADKVSDKNVAITVNADIKSTDAVISNTSAESSIADNCAGNVKASGKILDKGEGFEPRKRDVPGSTAFVPSMAGLLIGGEVIKDLTRAEFAAARSSL